MGTYARTFRELDVYKDAFHAAMEIYEMTKKLPPAERFGLTDQIRRSLRSVCATIAEAWRKRMYVPAFKSKIADAMQEASETQCWLDFCRACGYMDAATFAHLDDEYERILGRRNTMSMNAEAFCFREE